jgi:hypothetical protein
MCKRTTDLSRLQIGAQPGAHVDNAAISDHRGWQLAQKRIRRLRDCIEEKIKNKL